MGWDELLAGRVVQGMQDWMGPKGSASGAGGEEGGQRGSRYNQAEGVKNAQAAGSEALARRPWP